MNVVVMTKNYKHPGSLGDGQSAHERLIASVVNVAAVSYCYRHMPQLSQMTHDTVDFNGYLSII